MEKIRGDEMVRDFFETYATSLYDIPCLDYPKCYGKGT